MTLMGQANDVTGCAT